MPELWLPPGELRVISGGHTSYVGLLPDNSALQYPRDKGNRFSWKALDTEGCIHLALGDHERVVKYLGKEEFGLRLQCAMNGDVRRYMEVTEPDDISLALQLKWSMQAAEALAFVHSRSVIHCDVHPTNFSSMDGLTFKSAILPAPCSATWTGQVWDLFDSSFQDIFTLHRM